MGFGVDQHAARFEKVTLKPLHFPGERTLKIGLVLFIQVAPEQLVNRQTKRSLRRNPKPLRHARVR